MLKALPAADGQAQASQIAAATGIPRPTVHRLLQQLEGIGAVTRIGDRWELGAGLLELGALVEPHGRLRAAASIVAQELRASTGATVSVVVPDGDRFIAIEMMPGRHDLPFTSRTGAVMPANTAAARVLADHPSAPTTAEDDEEVIAGITCYAVRIPLPSVRAALQVATTPEHHARALAPDVRRAAALIATRMSHGPNYTG